MHIVIYYKDGQEQRIEGGMRTFFEACARLDTIAWEAGKEVIGVCLMQGETAITVTPLHFVWRPAVMQEMVVLGAHR
jgi:hypothetical protein